MKSNTIMARRMRLLGHHFASVKDGPVFRYRPKTKDAHDHWKDTGVCPSCLMRAISAGACIQCGHRPSTPTTNQAV